MPRFQYTAMDASGKEVKDRIEADTEQEAGNLLRQKGLYPINVTAIKGAKSGAKAGKAGGKATAGSAGVGSMLGSPKIRRKDLTTATRQLATLLDAGLPLVRAVRTLERQAKTNPPLRKVLGSVADSVEGGSTFSEALASHPKSFNHLYVNMVRAGEASGALETVLNRLAEFMEKAARIMGKVKSAMIYPVIVLTVAGGITSALMVFIVPKFAKMFDEMLPGEPLPQLTNIVITISTFMKEHILIMIGGLVGFIIVVKFLKSTGPGAYAFDWLAITVPPFNSLAMRSSVARFCRTLGTLMQSGVAVLQALQIVRDTAGNAIISRAIQDVHDAVKEGEGMTKPLEAAGVFPGMVVSMIEVGEETGALPEMLNRVADVYEEEVDRAVEALTSLIEPVMIVVLAVIVGGIVIALFLPLIKLIDKLGG
ncbi:MAG: type II secretion system F family protein [Victivallales bacterium]|nr:type II secretion system F family protein [Victivallales bacterium]MBT7163866.1 type II secretion system F family protein [Victivallales bacterium]MBT7298691.1 type II secretion system F family protein [Victivallales bacterium]